MKVNIKGKLQSLLSSETSLQRKFGRRAGKIWDLLQQFKEASPSDIFRISGNPHRLNFQPAGVYSVTVVHPYRCVFHVDMPRELVTILDVIDYHDHSLKTYAI